MTDLSIRTLVLACALSTTLLASEAWAQRTARDLKPGDYIAAVVNQDVVAASEVSQRLERAIEESRRRGDTLPDRETLRKEALEALIVDRVLVTYARENGVRIDEPELDRVVANVAAQNKLTLEQLRERLREEGMDYRRFRENLRDQMMTERAREREVLGRIRITDGEIDKYLDELRAKAEVRSQLNIAQILVPVAETASSTQRAERQARAQSALDRIKAGEDFAKVAKEVSEDANKDRGGEIGLRAADRLPDVFVDFVRELQPGQINPRLLASEAGYHVIKLLERGQAASIGAVTQTRSRHILLNVSPQLSPELAARRLAELKRQIESGKISFEDAAKQNSVDGSAQDGGDLGWMSPGGFVPEFEEAMNPLAAGKISEPFMSRFGVHLVQVLERRTIDLEPKQLREQARTALRERKYDESYKEWVKDLRAKAFVEMREWLD